jgi:hypothetical protein
MPNNRSYFDDDDDSDDESPRMSYNRHYRRDESPYRYQPMQHTKPADYTPFPAQPNEVPVDVTRMKGKIS